MMSDEGKSAGLVSVSENCPTVDAFGLAVTFSLY